MFDLLKSHLPQVAASLVVAVIAAFIVHRFIHAKMRLVAEITISPAKISKAAEKRLAGKELISDAILPPWGGLGGYPSQNYYLVVKLNNVGKKVIKGAAIRLSCHGFYQIDERDEMVSIKPNERSVVGDVFPNDHMMIHVWLWSIASIDTIAFARRAIKISAEEIDSVKVRFPLPDYIRDQKSWRAMAIMLCLAALISVAILAANIVVLK